MVHLNTYFKVIDDLGNIISKDGQEILFNSVEEAIDYLLGDNYKPGHIKLMTFEEVKVLNF